MYLYNPIFDDTVMYHKPHHGDIAYESSYSDHDPGSVIKAHHYSHCGNGLFDYEYRMQDINRDLQDALHMPSQTHMSQAMEVAIPTEQAHMYGAPCGGMYSNGTRLHSPGGFTDLSPTGSPPPPPRVYKPCVVCNDRSSGYHYGVSSCEGCKGFFRRSVQKNMQYTCHKEKTCVINKVTRNRCQYCRLMKCFAKGMSKDGRCPTTSEKKAVRNDRNKKRKQKPDSCASSHSVEDLTEDELGLISILEQAHTETFPMECNDERYNLGPLQEGDELILWERVYELSTAGIVCIVNFAKRVPGFLSLSNSDQITLLKSACLEIIILRLSSRFNEVDSTISFSNGLTLNREQLQCGGFGVITETIFNFAASMKQLNVDDTEYALLSAVCLISGDRSGLESSERIEHMQEPILAALNHYVKQQHPRQSHIFAKVLMKLTDLRSISVAGAKTVLSMQNEMSPLIREMLDRKENVQIPPIPVKQEQMTQL
ncbi:retinoic acid receptor alpha-A-like isoform X2 [Lineus longissimus]|uniref:retinoic acid receptor alpha-A-like isoform X2 n=1 Tax=Lineus longissimus TaxID=88925 RepID=UPI00315DC359